jgi:hypothetical protein
MAARSVPVPLWKNRDYVFLWCGQAIIGLAIALLTTLNAHLRSAPALAEAMAA